MIAFPLMGAPVGCAGRICDGVQNVARSMAGEPRERHPRMSSPLFSIIVPCKNAGSTIGKTLASIRSQTFQEIEVIVIDGASVDSTSEVVAEFPDTVTHFLSEPDNGVYSAMNKGVRLSVGEWLLFLGANDELSAPDVLQLVQAEANQHDVVVDFQPAADLPAVIGDRVQIEQVMINLLR